MKMHELKIQSHHFADVVTGIKRAEVRKNDRGFSAGDYLQLNEIDDEGEPTGEGVQVLVTHILAGGDYGILKEYCVLSFSLHARTKVHEFLPEAIAGQVVIGCESEADQLERLFMELRKNA